MSKTRLASSLLALILLLTAPPARAQVMANRIPSDALLYAGWAGSDALGPDYDASHLKAFLTTLRLPQLLANLLQDEMKRASTPDKADDLAIQHDWLLALTRSPTALYVGGIDFTDPRQPIPRIAIISQLGNANASAMAPRLDAIWKRAVHADIPRGVAVMGDYLVVHAGVSGLESRLTGPIPSDNLAATDHFKHALAQVGSSAHTPAFVIYADAEIAMHAFQQVLNSSPLTQDPATRQQALNIATGLGLNSLRQVAWAGSFDGPDWRSAGFLGMTDRRSGLLSFLDNKPLSQASLKLIPGSAIFAGAFRFDGQRLLADLAELAAGINDRAPQQMEVRFQQIFAFTGVDLKNDLLPSLGDEFIYYGTPDAAGTSIRGLTLINQLRDPQKAATALDALENIVNLLILQRDPNSSAQFRTQPLPAPLDKITAHVMALDRISPAWAICDGKLFVALSVPGLQGAIEAAAAKDSRPSILENRQFAALRKKLVADGALQDFSSFSFVDLARGAPESYGIMSLLLRTGELSNPGLPHPFTLPPLDRITPDLGPVLQVYWSDADGFHSRESGPFPLASRLSPSQFLWLRLLQAVEARAAQRPTPQPAQQPGAPQLP